MARIRTIKPEFWSSEDVMNCSREARLLFIGIWNFADDTGICVNSARTIKAQVFPGDSDIDSTNVRGWIDELSKNGLIKEYEVEAKAYFVITGWKHQRIDKPRPSKNPHPTFPDHSKNDPRPFDAHDATDLILPYPKGSYLTGSKALGCAPVEGAAARRVEASEELKSKMRLRSA